MLGTRTCAAGQWGECEQGAPSLDPGRCGAGCAACPVERADRCREGLCACGAGPTCAAGDACCGGACTRLEDDPGHCGACGQDCGRRLLHVTAPACAAGACDYAACAEGFLDCDGDRTNGCETPITDADCGACGRACAAQVQAATGAHCAFLPDGARACAYAACELEALDCDGDPANGCERPRSGRDCAGCGDDCRAPDSGGAECMHFGGQGFRCGCLSTGDCGLQLGAPQCCAGRCLPPDDPMHCGGCGQACGPAQGGRRCLDPAAGRCGCRDEGDCGPGELCCDERCTPRADDQCLACGEACAPAAGGPRCDPLAPACECLTDGECRDLPGGRQTCGALVDPHACTCGLLGRACAGGPESQCCPGLTGALGCVNLLDDPRNCGACGQECAPGMACVGGSCRCSALGEVGCPADGPAPHCRGSACACPARGDGALACEPGWTCCDGGQGGQGGPGGGPDEGCCERPCGENGVGECAPT